MRAFVVESFDQPAEVRDVPDATPEAGELLVRVRAAGVNPVEYQTVQGWVVPYIEHRFPLIPGVEFSGEVVHAVGGFSEGDAVYGSPDRDWFGEGTWAELVRVAPNQVASKPDSIDHVQASGVTTAGLTGLEGVETADVAPGGTLVIVGATGGVGGYAVQIAAKRGIHVIAVGRGENADYARELGAAETIDYTAGDVAEQILAAHPGGVDAVFDTFSDTDGLVKLAPAVKAGGKLVSPKGAADPDAIGATGRTGVNAGRAGIERLADMNAWFDAGDLVPLATRTYPLEKAADALQEIGAGHVRGKLALTLD